MPRKFSIHDPPGYIKPSLQDLLLTDITADELEIIAKRLDVCRVLVTSGVISGLFSSFWRDSWIKQTALDQSLLLQIRRQSKAHQHHLSRGHWLSVHLSDKAMEALTDSPGCDILDLMIQSDSVTVCRISPRDKHFSNVNVLGMDFLVKNRLSLSLDHHRETFRLIQ
jgi:hypothetical protein